MLNETPKHHHDEYVPKYVGIVLLIWIIALTLIVIYQHEEITKWKIQQTQQNQLH